MLKAVCIVLGVAVNALPADIELAPNGRGTNFATVEGSTLEGSALEFDSCVAAWPQPLPKAIIKSFINNSITVFGELQAGSRNTLNTQSGLADGPSSLPTFTHVQNLTDFLLDEASPNSYACDLIEAACGTICGTIGIDTVPGCIGLGARAIVACEIAGWGPWDPGADACAITMSGAVTGFCVAAVDGAAKVFGTVGCIAAFGCA